jgi:hypothetical protein
VDTTVAEACLGLLEGRATSAAVLDGDRVIATLTLADLARVPEGVPPARWTVGDLLAARWADALGPFTGSPCDHRPYSARPRSGMVTP